MHLVYHGLSADFTRLLEQDRPRPETNGHLRVLGVGRLVAKKGFDTLVDACALLDARGVPFEALIVGQDDKDGAQLRAHIERSGVPVALPGPVGPAELLDEYRRAGALCMPSRLLPNDRDGIPNVLVEAMAAGAPVVASNVSGIPELVEDEVNGLLVAPDDPQALADALVRAPRGPRAGRPPHRERRARRCASALTASAWRRTSRRCSGRRSRDDRHGRRRASAARVLRQ